MQPRYTPLRFRSISRFGSLSLAFVALCSVSCASSAQRTSSKTASAAASTAEAHTWHLKREERSAPLTDWQTHQTRNFKMMSMLLPVGWQLDVRPGPNFATIDCADNSGRIIVTATSPDKSTGILVFPANASMFSNSQAFLQQKQGVMRNFKGAFNCRIEQPKPLTVALPEGAATIAPGSRLVGQVEPVPGLTDEIAQVVANANERGGSQITAEAGRQRLAGVFQGKQAEMWLVALATHRTETVPGAPRSITTCHSASSSTRRPDNWSRMKSC